MFIKTNAIIKQKESNFNAELRGRTSFIFSVLIVHCILYNVQCTWFSVLIVQCTMVQCTHCALYNIQWFSVLIVPCTMVQCTHCAMYNVQCTMYI